MAISAKEILRWMEVPDWPGVFVLGCEANRVTIVAQQNRAYNLFWALKLEGRLPVDSHVAVIGGGIGGLTTAAAAIGAGYRATVFERQGDLMHLQRGCLTRFLHPYIYDWPLRDWQESKTKLPWMNWNADNAAAVVDRLDQQWKAVVETHKVQIRTSAAVTGIGRDGTGLRVEQLCTRSDPFTAVVIAIGFGSETCMTGVKCSTYWESDALHQMAGNPPKRALVSGIGDSGCVDIFRLSYERFDHGRFATSVAQAADLQNYVPRLLEIENGLCNMDVTAAGNYLKAEYDGLNMPQELAASLGELRDDTAVLWTSSSVSYLTPRAALLHRLVAHALLVSGKVKYQTVRFNVGDVQSDSGSCWAQLPGQPGQERFQEIIIRHGHRRQLHAQFDLLAAKFVPHHNALGLHDPTQIPHFDASQFFPIGPVESAGPTRAELAAGMPQLQVPGGSPAVGLSGETKLHELCQEIEQQLRKGNDDKAFAAAERLEQFLDLQRAVIREEAIRVAISCLYLAEKRKLERDKALGRKPDTTGMLRLRRRMLHE